MGYINKTHFGSKSLFEGISYVNGPAIPGVMPRPAGLFCD